MKKNYSKGTSILLITLMYVIAAVTGVLIFSKLTPALPEIWALLIADAVATVIVWGWGLVYENVSVYDPYWSVAPPVIFTLWALYKGNFSLPVILLLVAVWYWGIRLTANWAGTFKGLGHEDWRYTRYRETQSPLLFQATNFFGLNMMPTVLVFFCMVPGLRIIESGASANLFSWIGWVICLLAASIQLLADTQIHRFRNEHPGQFCNVGLWKHGRHPNYFGEISFWWGIWVMYAAQAGLDILLLAPIAMTCLFLFISIPMMEKRQLATKPGYADYRLHSRRLI